MAAWRPVRLPAPPLVEAITDRARRRRIPLSMLLSESSQWRAYQRAQREGTVTLRAAEQFCDDLGWHPRELWGDQYDAAAFGKQVA